MSSSVAPRDRFPEASKRMRRLTEEEMNAPASITITPIRVADLLAEGERMPVYVHDATWPISSG